MALRISAFGLSHKGKVRPKNEDTMAVESSLGLVVVADGMGGAPAGEVASALAVEETCLGLHAGRGMKESVLRANKRILAMARSNPAFQGMGTTITVLRVDPDSGAFEIAHVGDSRAYRLHEGALWQLTRDHSAAQALVDAGTLSPEAARNHSMSHILSQALGTREDVEVELLLGLAEEGDRFLLCSDGLNRVLDDKELQDRLRAWDGTKVGGLVQELVDEANQRGSPDNVTVAVLAVD